MGPRASPIAHPARRAWRTLQASRVRAGRPPLRGGLRPPPRAVYAMLGRLLTRASPRFHLLRATSERRPQIESGRTQSSAALVVCYTRAGLSSYPCRGQVRRRRLGLHTQLYCLLVHPYAVVTHQGSRWLEGCGWLFGCRPTHNWRDVRRSWLSQAFSWRVKRGLACSRLFQGRARSCSEHSFSTHVYRGLACSASGCSGYLPAYLPKIVLLCCICSIATRAP
jgi:hypothetical protein